MATHSSYFDSWELQSQNFLVARSCRPSGVSDDEALWTVARSCRPSECLRLQWLVDWTMSRLWALLSAASSVCDEYFCLQFRGGLDYRRSTYHETTSTFTLWFHSKTMSMRLTEKYPSIPPLIGVQLVLLVSVAAAAAAASQWFSWCCSLWSDAGGARISFMLQYLVHSQ